MQALTSVRRQKSWALARNVGHPLHRSQFHGAMDELSGRFKVQALTCCDAEIMSTRTAAGQFRVSSSGAMEESSRQGQKASTPQSLLSWTLQLSKLATPLERLETPPPCEPKSEP